MRSDANPFTDPGQVRGALYASADRIARRTGALHRARVNGRHAGEVICDLAADAAGTGTGLIADLGCGRGTITRMLAERLPSARVIGADLSAALLVAARQRLRKGWRAMAGAAAARESVTIAGRPERVAVADAFAVLVLSDAPERLDG